MSAQLVVFMGPARSGKTHELLRQYRAIFTGRPSQGFDRAIWLAPNGSTAAAVRENLVRAGLAAALRPGVLTFDDLAKQILAATHTRFKRLPPVLRRELLRRVVDHALKVDKLPFFADAAHRAGFIALLANHFDELQRAGIRPDAYANVALRRADDRQHTELAQLFADYQSELSTLQIIDHESALSAARNALADGSCPRFQNLELIVADGFTDFTRTQHEILGRLSRTAKQLLISLPADPTDSADPSRRTGRFSDQSPPAQNHFPNRPDLFAKTATTLSELEQYHPHLDVRQFAPRPLACPAIDFLTQHIFRHPKHIPAPAASVLDSLPQLEIVEAAGAQDEIVQIARRVKAMLTGSRPGDILVVFRTLTDAAPRIREVFTRFGIPYSLDAGQPIVSAAIIKTFLALLRLDGEDWPFRRVVAALTNNTLAALDGGARRAAEWLARDLQIASGRRALLDRVKSLAEDSSSPNDRSEHLQHRVDAAAAAIPALTQLANALDGLPTKATPTQWCNALARLATHLAIPPFDTTATSLRTGRFSDQLTPANSNPLTVTDLAAWHAIVTHFAALERLDAWLGQPPRELSRAELLTALLDVSTNEFLPRSHEAAGRVCVVAAPAARNITVPHLFLAGMSEQAFPLSERPGNLATDADYRFFAQAAHQDVTPTSTLAATRAQAEMLLFYEVLSRAEESLTISYPALDDKAQTLPPSPYVVELQRVLGDEGASRICHAYPQLSPSRSAEPRPTNDSRCRSARGTYSIPDWRIGAVARATDTEGDCHALAGIFACQETGPLAAAIDAGLRIVHARARGDSFGPAEGLLASPAIAARLAQRFGPQHTWSASQWETYASCPFRFFMQEVLGLEPLGDLVLETDFARRGSRLHDVLATFHRQWLAARPDRSMPPEEEAAAFLAHLQQVIHERTSVTTRVGVDAALLELDRRQILQWAVRHFDNQAKYDSGCMKLGAAMKPTHFEFRFGPPRRGDTQADPDSTAQAFVLDIDGEPIQITGQIDRIDVGTLDGKPVFNVIDYKSGRRASLKRDQLETGQQLQLPIYVEAAQLLVFGNEATPLAAGYWGMGSGFDSRGALAAPGDDATGSRWPATQSAVHRLIREFIEAIRHGDFPVASRDKDCTSTCDYHMTCRVTQIRSLQKTWWPESDCGSTRNAVPGDP